MVLDAVCDICGEKSSGCQDWDGADLCRKCEIKKELTYLKEQRKSLRDWLKRIHIKELNDMNKKIKKLQEESNGI